MANGDIRARRTNGDDGLLCHRRWCCSLRFGFVMVVVAVMWAMLISPSEGAPAQAQAPTSTPVVVLVLDELPLTALLRSDLAINAERFPNFAALADTADWFRYAASVSPQTRSAVPAIMTGTRPDSALEPTWEDHPTNLLSVLLPSHEVHRYEVVTSLCPPSACPSSPHVGYGTFPVEMFRGRALMEVEAISEKPLLLFGHLVAPHLPWVALPDGSTYANFSPPGMEAGPAGLRWEGDERDRMLGYQRLLLQVGAMDQALGEMRGVLEDRGLWDDALVVVTADHGIHFEAGDLRAIGAGGPEVSSVPLFIKQPGQQVGRLDERAALTMDVAPTVLGLLGATAPGPVEGLDLYRDPVPLVREAAFVISATSQATPDQTSEGLEAVVGRRSVWIDPDGDWTEVHQPGIAERLIGRDLGSFGEPLATDFSWQRTGDAASRLVAGDLAISTLGRPVTALAVCDGVIAGAVEVPFPHHLSQRIHLFAHGDLCTDPAGTTLVLLDADGRLRAPSSTRSVLLATGDGSAWTTEVDIPAGATLVVRHWFRSDAPILESDLAVTASVPEPLLLVADSTRFCSGGEPRDSIDLTGGELTCELVDDAFAWSLDHRHLDLRPTRTLTTDDGWQFVEYKLNGPTAQSPGTCDGPAYPVKELLIEAGFSSDPSGAHVSSNLVRVEWASDDETCNVGDIPIASPHTLAGLAGAVVFWAVVTAHRNIRLRRRLVAVRRVPG